MHTQHNFSPGDVVVLKSDGPLMTVAIVVGDDITVDYFDGNKHKRHALKSWTLIKAVEVELRNEAWRRELASKKPRQFTPEELQDLDDCCMAQARSERENRWPDDGRDE